MPGWFFQLQGSEPDLEQMATVFDGGPVRVRREGDQFWMTSSSLDGVTDHRSAYEAAEATLQTLNGIALLRVQNSGRAILGRAEYGEAESPRNIFIFLQGIEVTTRVGTATVSAGGQGSSPREDPLLALATRDSDVSEVMRLYGSRDPDWGDLYFILGVVETELGMAVSKKGWTPETTRQLFRRTSNSRAAIGNLARHGEGRMPPPPRPMSLPEARRLIRDIVGRWVREKL